MEKVNTLQEWEQVVFRLSSKYALKPPVFDREQVVHIAAKLRSHFPEKFFLIKAGEDRRVSDLNIVARLLRNAESFSAQVALHEIGELLDYGKAHFPSAYERAMDLAHRNVHSDFNSTLFELFVFKQFHLTGVNGRFDVVHLNRPIEGLVEILDRKFLVECKKPFVPDSNAMDDLRRTIEVIRHRLSSVRVRTGFKLIVLVQKGFKTYVGGAVGAAVKTLMAQYAAGCGQFHEDFESVHSGFRVIVRREYDERGFDEEQSSYGVIATVGNAPPLPSTMVIRVPISIEGFVSVLESEILEKLVGVIKEAKRQHRESEEPLVLFIDSQIIPDFQQGLVLRARMLNDPKFAAAITRASAGIITVLLLRTYSKEGMRVIAAVYSDEALQDYADFLRKHVLVQRTWI